MSKNFELLLRAEKEAEIFRTSIGSPAPSNGKRAQLNLEQMVRDEEIKLVQRLFLLRGQDAPRVVVYCGVASGTGVSGICARGSEILAGQGVGTVCVVDANLPSPTLHQHFGVDNLCGLSDAVFESGPVRNFCRQLPGANYWVMPSGSRAGDRQVLLAPDRLRARISELRKEFDYVLIDAPPATLHTDAILLGQMADGVILVLESNSTRREAARKAKEVLEAANVRILGAVLNNRTFPIPEALYRKL